MSFKRLSSFTWLLLGALALRPAIAQDLKAREQRLRQLSSSEKEDLQRKERRFLALSSDQQTKLREFHQAVQEAPDSSELLQVMTRYHAWLKALRPGQRAEILSLPAEQRIVKIREIMQEQAARRFQHFAATKLDRADYKTLTDWMHQFVEKHEAEIMQLVPAKKREWMAERPLPERHLRLGGYWGMAKPEETPLPQKDMDQLIQQLSQEAQAELKRQTDPRQRIVLVKTWVRTALFSAMRPGFGARQPVSEEELQRFMREELTQNEREYLENMPVERMRRELEMKYHFSKNRRDWGPRSPNGPMRNQPPPPPTTDEP